MAFSSDGFDSDELDDAALLAASQEPVVLINRNDNGLHKRKKESVYGSQSKKVMSQFSSHPATSQLAVRLLQRHFG